LKTLVSKRYDRRRRLKEYIGSKKPVAAMPSYEQEISRVTRSRSEAQANYDRISRWYDLFEGIWERNARNIGLEKLAVREGETVLEIGFGTGHGIASLARSVGKSGKVYGIDLSPRMLELTSAKIARMGLSPRVVLKCGDALELFYEEKFFDAVFISFALELFDTPEIPRLLGKCFLVLRNGGRICVVSISKEGTSKPMRNIYEFGHQKLPRLLDCRPIFVRKSLGQTGFEILDSARMSILGLPVEIVLARKPS
jgi:ubiquinone/menaquinone biosynthesis C-methylase UbiE